jgi:hypothetical protein
MIPPTSTTPVTVDDVKAILGITSTDYDAFIGNNLYETAKYANDFTHNGLGKCFIPTNSQYTALAASSSPAIIMPWLVEQSVVVFSSDQAKIYTEDHDYEVDYKAGTLCYLDGSTYGTSTGGSAIVHYQFIYPTGGAKTAIAQLLRHSWGNDPSVVSESIGPLSRTYSNNDIPAPILKLLKPYRIAKFV